MMILEDLLASASFDGVGLRDIRIGPFWTVVWTERGAGLASTQRDIHTPHGDSPIRWAGKLLEHNTRELAELLRSSSTMEAAIGMATINAVLDIDETALSDRNASEEIIRRGRDKRVVIVGHFPFIPRVKDAVGHLDVLEFRPGPGELPAGEMAAVIPRADVVAITGTSLLNKTFDCLMSLCRPDAFVLMLGPTSPLSPVLFEYGVNLIAGTRVIDPPLALATTSQGAVFPQMGGVRLVTMTQDRK